MPSSTIGSAIHIFIMRTKDLVLDRPSHLCSTDSLYLSLVYLEPTRHTNAHPEPYWRTEFLNKNGSKSLLFYASFMAYLGDSDLDEPIPF